MAVLRTVIAVSLLVGRIAAQTIYPADVWTTTWDRTKSFTQGASTGASINFVSPGPIGSADIVVSDGTVYQQMVCALYSGLIVCNSHVARGISRTDSVVH